ncbi:hypothetical protein E2P81_ATG00171 [Venturia nashicola]|nr:hypothetical protein E2P81_ATG00171 [Venturia nashicola]
MATTTALTSTTSAIGATTSSTVLDTTSSLLSTVTTDLTLTSTALLSATSSTPIISATTTFSPDTTFDPSTTSAFSTAPTVINSQSASATEAASSSNPTQLSSDAMNLKPTTIAGIAIAAGGLILLIILASLCICLARRRKMKSNQPQITFQPRSPSRASDEDLEKSSASSQSQEIESVEDEILPKSQSMGGSTLLAVPHDKPTVERFSWKAQTAEHLHVTPPAENRPFSWMKQDEEQYPTAEDNISPDAVQWRPASELLGQPPVRNGSPLSLPPHMIRAPPSHDSLHSSFVPSTATRQSFHSDTMLRNQIKQAFNNGARQSLYYVNSPLSDPAAARWRGSEIGSIIDENMEANSRFSGETLGKLRSEHTRIQNERFRISRLQQLDEEEDWIKHQIANVETRRASNISRAY